MNQQSYENTAYTEYANIDTERKPQAAPEKRRSKCRITLVVLVTVSLVVSICSLVIAILSLVQSQETEELPALDYQRNNTEYSITNLQTELKELKAESEELQKKLSASVNGSQEALWNAVKQLTENQQESEKKLSACVNGSQEVLWNAVKQLTENQQESEKKISVLNNTVDSHHKTPGLSFCN